MFAKAPLCIAVLALPSGSPIEDLMESAGLTQEEHDRLCVRPELQSAGAAVQLLTTSAHAMGYATCWTCAPIVAGERLEQLLLVDSPARLVALVAIGRASEQPTGTEEVVAGRDAHVPLITAPPRLAPGATGRSLPVEREERPATVVFDGRGPLGRRWRRPRPGRRRRRRSRPPVGARSPGRQAACAAFCALAASVASACTCTRPK